MIDIKQYLKETNTVLLTKEYFEQMKAETVALQNRCYVLSTGTMCGFCKYDCKHKAESDE